MFRLVVHFLNRWKYFLCFFKIPDSHTKRLKVTVHRERCFQFSVCNLVNTHRTPTNLYMYINGKLIKLFSLWRWIFSKKFLFVNEWPFHVSMSMRLSASIYAICILFISFSTICALIPSWGFLIEIVFNFLQAFEENSPFCSLQKIIGAEFQNSPGQFSSSAIMLSTC